MCTSIFKFHDLADSPWLFFFLFLFLFLSFLKKRISYRLREAHNEDFLNTICFFPLLYNELYTAKKGIT